MRLRGVNSILVATVIACGPRPSSVIPGAAPAHPTPLVNQRRAGYENEAIPAAPKVVWDVDAGTGMRGTLVLVNQAVLAATTNRQMIAFNAEDGVRHWDQRFGAAVSSTPMYDRGRIYVGTTQYEGTLFALGVERGRRVWKNEIGPVRFSPLVDAGIVFVGADNGAVAALRAESGGQMWRANLRSSIAESLVDAGAHVIVITANDSVFALRKNDGAVIARGTVPATPSATPALHAGTLVVATQTGAVLGIDANTLVTKWQVRANGPVMTSPAIASDGTVYIASRSGTLYRITNGELHAVETLDHSVSSLTMTRDHFLLGSYDGTLLAVDRSGDVAWKHKFNDSIVAPVAVRDQAIYVPLLHGRVVKLR